MIGGLLKTVAGVGIGPVINNALGDVISIPGNIKQTYLPFVLDPNAGINKSHTTSEDLKRFAPQLFSFRSRKKSTAPGGFGLLNICPESYKKYIKRDISNRLGYNYYDGPDSSYKSISLNDLFQTIPGVQIREFLVDSRMDQVFNLFTSAFDSILANFKDVQGDGIMAKIGNILDQFATVFEAAFDYIFAIGEPNAITDLKATLEQYFQKTGMYSISGANWLSDLAVLYFPFVMYTRLQSCSTTNVYELPCLLQNKLLYGSDGNPGWTDANVSLTQVVGDKLGPLKGIVGDFLKGAMNGIRINYTPFWNPEKGSSTMPPEVKIEFDLYNDTLDSALMNFIFVNTIVPNARWLQYGVFQHPSSLYDIKLEGYDRLFVCSGKFEVTYNGILRQPSEAFLDKLIKQHLNVNGRAIKNVTKFDILNNQLIKIPDTYHVTMTFKSLLPANINTYIYTYANNINITNYANADSQLTYQPSAIQVIQTTFADGLSKQITKRVNQSIDEGKGVVAAVKSLVSDSENDGNENKGVLDKTKDKAKNAWSKLK